MPTIAVLGTYDTKGQELTFLGAEIRRQGLSVISIDVSTLAHDGPGADFPSDAVAARSSVAEWKKVLDRRDRGASIALMGDGAARLLSELATSGRIQGAISMGGGGGTSIGSTAMHALPFGFPKIMVTTLASGNTAPYIGTSDLVLFPAVVDIAGLNRISRITFENAAGAICGMVNAVGRRTKATSTDKPIVAASMFGNTTACITEAKRFLEEAGYEVLVFHATGTGGRNMEALIDSGLVSAVLDLTTTEWADELVGGILSAGPTRLDAAAKRGVPTILAPGCLDMVNFGEPNTVPPRFAGRRFYQHNPQATLLRTNAEESSRLGRILAEKANAHKGPVQLYLPLKGLSAIGAPGQPFHDAQADAALFSAIREHLRPGIPLFELDAGINDRSFAQACAHGLLELLHKTSSA